jgi:hypothetical protein
MIRTRYSILAASVLLGAVQFFGQLAPSSDPIPRQVWLTYAPGVDQTATGRGGIPSLLAGDPFEREGKEEEQEFTRRFNTLVGALHDFSTTYNAGHLIDVKKVRAVRKAWLDLEKTGWFRPETPR